MTLLDSQIPRTEISGADVCWLSWWWGLHTVASLPKIAIYRHTTENHLKSSPKNSTLNLPAPAFTGGRLLDSLGTHKRLS